jgi:hypothetical protein
VCVTENYELPRLGTLVIGNVRRPPCVTHRCGALVGIPTIECPVSTLRYIQVWSSSWASLTIKCPVSTLRYTQVWSSTLHYTGVELVVGIPDDRVPGLHPALHSQVAMAAKTPNRRLSAQKPVGGKPEQENRGLAHMWWWQQVDGSGCPTTTIIVVARVVQKTIQSALAAAKRKALQDTNNIC